MPDLDALLAFWEVAHLGNMGRAAERLHISQPPLSRKIARLEKQLGLQLFTRHAEGMSLTDEGRRLAPIVKDLLDVAQRSSQAMAALMANSPEELKIGLSTAFEMGRYRKLTQAKMKLKPSFICAPSPALVRMARRGSIDAALVALPVELEGCALLEMAEAESLMAFVPSCWPEAGRKTLTLRELDGKPLFWFKKRRNPLYFEYMREIFSQRAFRPIFFEEPLEHEVLMTRIAFGEGWALMPGSFSLLKREGVRVLPMSGEGELKLRIGLVWKEGKLGEEQGKALIRLLES